MQVKSNSNALKLAHIIAMTTTGAAKNRDLVRSLNSEIMIVEEAAEIHEPHITSAMP